MPFISTPKTIAQGRVSALAICETLIAIGTSLAVCILTGTFLHLAVASVIAPVLLLQTKRSMQQTQIWVSEYVQIDLSEPRFGLIRADRFLSNVVHRRWWSLIFYPVYIVMKYFNFLTGSKFAIFNGLAYLRLWIVLLIFRVYAIVYSMVREPLRSIRQVPVNWKTVVLSIDSFHVPEMIPGIEEIQDGPLSELKAQNIFKMEVDPFYIMDLKPTTVLYILGGIIFNKILFLIALIPAYLYRFSLKSTAFIWSPLLWVMSIAEDQMPIDRRLIVICKTVWYKISRWYSLFVIVMFAIKWAILVGVLEWDFFLWHYYSEHPQLTILNLYIEPAFIPRWQLAAVVNAVLSLMLFIFANWYMIAGSPIPGYVLPTIKTSSIVRLAITWYTISCGIYIAIYGSTNLPLPPLGRKFFPWE